MDSGERDDIIMISAIQHHSYCPRQCALIHVEQQFSSNVHTARGDAVHARVDEPGWETQPGARVERALPIWSDRLGLAGRCDAVEFRHDGSIYPVETKHGPRKAKVHDDLQLAAQAICLEEMTGKPVPRGAIYHHTSRRRREVAITDALRHQVEEITVAVRGLLASGRLPLPVNDVRCKECSLKDICQPEALMAKPAQISLLSSLFVPD
ncbi:CRISPR-associated exonuclease, Cas4 family [Nitrosospira sp. Nsp18]|uniref:CRISPR-associated protein Cas4 n=1 Tax=Nitrosospira sp. Nsp18 TaxID=1855334 RepID=UPI000880B1E0|nr:CRISPR-associated protein Cas4 [Nitrosospira sp. Nsp18]SDA26089.1 CRISPR-associated exonuclease, Cas4 family [Nitrosospira sp. Nsp18]